MRITESMIRRIIKEEAKRVIKESEEEAENLMDPVGLVERYMTDIEDLFMGGYDHDEAMDEANDMIDDLCKNLGGSMRSWLMDYLRDDQMPRAEFEDDMEEDR